MFKLDLVSMLLLLLGQVVVNSYASDHCESLEGVLHSNPQCTAVHCSGLNCTPPTPFEEYTASFTVAKCTDPVTVNLTITSSNGTVSLEFDRSQTVHFGGDISVGVEMSRNATHVDFQATIFHNATDSVSLFPESLIPLDPADCMCSSLEALASKLENIHPIVESDCVTTRNCTGVRCALNISAGFTARYFGEVVVLPCENALEFLVEKLAEEIILIEDRFQGPVNETKIVEIGGLEFLAGQFIEVMDYSLTAESFFFGPGIGRISVIPWHTIILDRTHCDTPQFPTVSMPTRPPPPRSLGPDASSACTEFHQVAQNVYENSPVFRCEVNDQCDSGLSCTLNVVFTEYKVEIKISEGAVILLIFSGDGKIRHGQFKNENVTLSLPEPRGAFLEFTHNVGSQSIGFMLQLRVSLLTTGQQTEELIPYTVITFNQPSTNLTAIIVPIVIVLLMLIAVVITVVVVFCLYKSRKLNASNFRKMSISQKDNPNEVAVAMKGESVQEKDDEIKMDL